MGLAKDEEFLYYFDSHSRGPRGWVIADGSACILQYTLNEGVGKKIKTLVYHNIKPVPFIPTMTDGEINEHFAHSISLINPTRADEIEIDPNSDNELESAMANLEVSPSTSPTKKKPRNDNNDVIEDDMDEINVEESNQIPDPFHAIGNLADNGKAGDIDCVIDRDDFVEPTLEQYINKMKTAELHRKTGRPLDSGFEKDLDLLGFPNLFPMGINGMNAERKIHTTKLDYFQQRLMSSDRRFSKNTDFLFYALSETEKSKVEQKISVCCNLQTEGQRNEGQNELLPASAINPHLYMSAIRGSATYWKKYTGDLIAMVKQLPMPTFFVTFSFDDLNALDSVLANYKAEHGFAAELTDASSLDFGTRKELLNNHPITAARHSHMKFNKVLALLKSHSVSIFGYLMTDYALRVEFQGRGSPHAHCLIWLEGAPDFNTPEGIEFINKNISCSLAIENKNEVLRYQKHRHTATCYKNKNTQCRFHFPRKVTPATEVVNEEEIHRNGGRFVHLKRTTDEIMINNYHPALLQILKCNMDIQPVTGAMAIAYYIAKYMSKAEPMELKAEIQEGIRKVQDNGNLSAQHKMRRISQILMRNREISAQEAAFRMCHLFLKATSRATIFLPTYMKDCRIRMVRQETMGTGDPQLCLNIIDRYMARPNELERLCLYEFAAHYAPVVGKKKLDEGDLEDDHEHLHPDDVTDESTVRTLKLKDNKGRIFKRKRPAILKSPNFHAINDSRAYYYSLILKYMPFRTENFCDAVDPAEFFKQNYRTFRKHSDDPVIQMELAQEIDSALLRITDLANNPQVSNLDLEEDFDLDFQDIVDQDPVTPQEVFPEPQLVIDTRELYNTLSPDQKEVVDKVREKILEPSTAANPKKPLRLIVSGEAGMGKSYTIGVVKHLIRNMLSAESVMVCAPTGIASFLIKGMTIHRAFSLGVELGKLAKYNKLGSQRLSEFRKTCKNLKWIILDEMSMINYHTIRQVHLRLQEIFQNDEQFGGCNVLFFGDLLQLKPPKGTWIFEKSQIYASEVDLWRECDFVELTQHHRQESADPLLGICSRLRVGELEQSDIDILSERRLDPKRQDYAQKMEEFKDATWIFPLLAQVENFNSKKTQELPKFYTINAQDTYADGIKFGQKLADGLAPTRVQSCAGFAHSIKLGIGSRVMLRRNIDIPSGLVNGATGTVVGFTWTALRSEQLHEGDLPEYVHVEFDHHKIPGQPTHITKIKPMTANFYGKKHTHINRRAIPLVLAWAINIHKVQGVTLNKAVVDLGPKLFGKGMAYVAISRVKTLSGLAILSLDSAKLLKTDKYTPCDEKALEELKRLRAKRALNRQ